MKILSYSDLHMEFPADDSDYVTPNEKDADLLILAGDICTFTTSTAFDRLLKNWKTKPVMYVLGNHEYYNCYEMEGDKHAFEKHLRDTHPNVWLLDNEGSVFCANGNPDDCIEVFGGTMWTNLNKGNPLDMEIARSFMNDYRLITKKAPDILLQPADTLEFHQEFVEKLIEWFEEPLEEVPCRIIVTHHCPISEPTHDRKGNRWASYESHDMISLIEKYQPSLWIYGHTHTCTDIHIGNTRVISNPKGYPFRSESGKDFCREGKPINTNELLLNSLHPSPLPGEFIPLSVEK